MKLNEIAAALMVAFVAPVVAFADPPSHGPTPGTSPTGFSSNARIDADETALSDAFKQLKADVKAGHTSAYAGDITKIMSALSKLQTDRAALATAIANNRAVQAAQALVSADQLAVDRARTLLQADEIVGVHATIVADETALTAAETKLRADLRTLAAAIAAVNF